MSLIVARSTPSPLRERGNMRLRWWFRSPYVQHFSVNRVTRERAKGANRCTAMQCGLMPSPRTVHAPGARATRLKRP